MGTFKKYPAWTRWIKWGQIVSELTMNSQCTCWVSDPLPPVSSDRLVHRPYYRPFSAVDQGFTYPPFLVGADHYFEWRNSSHQYPIFTVNFCINPLFQFQSPHTILTNHLFFGCPCYQILWWDCPQHLPVAIAELLFLQEEQLEENSVGFLHFLEEFCQAYFTPIAPYPPAFNYTLGSRSAPLATNHSRLTSLRSP